MAKHLVTDMTGHTTYSFDLDNDVQVKEAMDRFTMLVGEEKKVAGVRGADGDFVRVSAFDPTAEETLFLSPMQGG